MKKGMHVTRSVAMAMIASLDNVMVFLVITFGISIDELLRKKSSDDKFCGIYENVVIGYATAVVGRLTTGTAEILQ